MEWRATGTVWPATRSKSERSALKDHVLTNTLMQLRIVSR